MEDPEEADCTEPSRGGNSRYRRQRLGEGAAGRPECLEPGEAGAEWRGVVERSCRAHQKNLTWALVSWV